MKVPTQRILALKFRIAEKKTLSFLGNITYEKCSHLTELDEDMITTWNIGQVTVSGLEESADQNHVLDEKIERFNTFVESLHLPVIKIKASYINETMRVGVIATQDIQEGEVYLSTPSSFVLDSDSFTVKEKDSLEMKLFESLKVNRGDGGFDVLLFCLLYETYVRKENSEWFPYIQMLPTLIELKQRSPLLLDDELYDYLAGSDVRLRLIDLKRSARIRFRAFSNDINMSRVLGIENMTFDKYLWAFAIIHSRSIWWNGTRHLVPLLDLVNCAELIDAAEGIITPHTTQKEGEHVITRASFTYKHGDQIFENYSQPNYIYFMFHGFILEGNQKDCILIDRVGYLESPQTDFSESTKKRLFENGFQSHHPSFCLHDKRSLDRFSNYLRIKYDLPGDGLGLGEDVRPLIMNEIERRLHLHKSINRYPLEPHSSDILRVMKKFLDIEYSHLIELNLLLTANFTDLTEY
jgi:histone-lysine N-methyltransferase SETD3